MSEPDVAITDFLLGVECAVLSALTLRGGGATRAGRWFAALYASVAAASVLGGVEHGFWPGTRGLTWKATLLCIGAAALSAFFAGSHLALPRTAGTRVRRAVAGLAVLYAVTVALWRSDFLVAIAGYLPSVLFLMAALYGAWKRTADRRMLWGIAGLAVTLAAAPLQQAGVGLHPRYLSHNALYHVVQGLGFFLLLPAARAAAHPRRETHAIAS